METLIPKTKTCLLRSTESSKLDKKLLEKLDELQDNQNDILDIKISHSVSLSNSGGTCSYVVLIIYQDPEDRYEKFTAFISEEHNKN